MAIKNNKHLFHEKKNTGQNISIGNTHIRKENILQEILMLQLDVKTIFFTSTKTSQAALKQLRANIHISNKKNASDSSSLGFTESMSMSEK